MYSNILDNARLLFNDFSHVKSPQIVANNFNKSDSKNMAKTNPVPKAKAADLSNNGEKFGTP